MSTFTSDWFSKNIPTWNKHLAKFKGVSCNAIELGSFEGRSAVWLLENILTHPSSLLTCVDVKLCENLVMNLAPFSASVDLVKYSSVAFLKTEFVSPKYDIAYIDADHIAKDVIMEAGLLWPMMREGGIMIFDDYGNKNWTVRDAVDFFIKHWSLKDRVLHLGHQAIIQC